MEFKYFYSIRQAWHIHLANRKNKITTATSFLFLVITLSIYPRFLNYIELRNGFVLNDYLLALFKPVNLSWLIFISLYSSCIIGIIKLIERPRIFTLAVQSYVLLVLFRMVAMFFVPLNPPVDSIVLIDPFVEFFGTGQSLTKDLFFSGHTATVFIFYLWAEKGWTKVFFLVSTICVATAVILQHVHYIIDVLAAPIITYIAFIVVRNKNDQT